MKKLLAVFIFLCLCIPAHASKVNVPAPSGRGTFIEPGDDVALGDVTVESLQGDAITVGRTPDETTTINSQIATTEDDYAIAGSNVFSDDGSAANVGRITNNRMEGFRFTNLNIPQGSVISEIRLQLLAINTTSRELNWKLGLVNETHPINPTSYETWPTDLDMYGTQDTGTQSGTTDQGIYYFPTASTGTTLIEGIQSLVNNPSWDSNSSILLVLADDTSGAAQYLTFYQRNVSSTDEQIPVLNIEYLAEFEYEAVASVKDNAPRIFLPDTLYGVAGDTLQLFVRGMVEAQDPYALPVIMTYNVTSGSDTVGRVYPRYFELELDSDDVSTEDFTVTVLDLDYNELATKTVDLVVTDPAATVAEPVNVAIVGNSLIANGELASELYRRVATADAGPPAGLGVDAGITFIGDKDMTSETGLQAYTGIPGWRFSTYIGEGSFAGELVTLDAHGRTNTCTNSTWTQGGNTWQIEYVDTNTIKLFASNGLTLPSGGGTLVHSGGTCNDPGNIVYTAGSASTSSPFWNEADDEFNFVEWEARNGTIDVMYILLGWNSIGSANRTDWTAYMDDVRTFIDQLHEDNVDAIVRLIGLQVPSPIGGLGASYDSDSAYGQYYPLLRSVNNLNAAYQDLANEALYSPFVEFIGAMPQVDSEYNMPKASADVNTRNSADQEVRGTNGIHPALTGYYQYADAVFRKFVNDFLE